MSIIESNNSSVEEILEREGVFASVTVGTSMRPLFKTRRDMVILKKPEQPPRKYDVVLYKIQKKYVLHRIVKVKADERIYVIRGDNTYKNEYVPFEKIIAVLDSFNRKGKHSCVTDRAYRIYSRVWTALYPLRKIAYPVFVLLRRLFRGKRQN